jgi:hypothetical protein
MQRIRIQDNSPCSRSALAALILCSQPWRFCSPPLPPPHPSAHLPLIVADAAGSPVWGEIHWNRVYMGAFKSNTFSSSSMKASYWSTPSSPMASPTSSVAAAIWRGGGLSGGAIWFSARVSSPSILWEESYGREGEFSWKLVFVMGGRENVFDPIDFFWEGKYNN